MTSNDTNFTQQPGAQQSIAPKPESFLSPDNLAKLRKILLRTTLTFLAASALLAIFIVLIYGNEFLLKTLGTTVLLSIFFIICMNNTLRLSSEHHSVKVAAAFAIVSNFVWAIPELFSLWGLIPTSYSYYGLIEFVSKLIYTGFGLAVAASIVSNFIEFYYTVKDTAVQVLSRVTILCTIIISVICFANIWFDFFISELWRLYFIIAIVFLFGLITTPILVKVKRSSTHKKTAQSPTDQAALRAEIEREVRAKIAAEQTAKSSTPAPTAEQSSPSAPEPAKPSVPHSATESKPSTETEVQETL